MSRRRKATLVVLLGLVGAGIAQLARPDGDLGVLILFGAGLALGELLVFVLPDGSSLPLSYSVLLVLASSFGVMQYGVVFAGAELFAIAVLRVRDTKPWYSRLGLRVAVAAATFAVWRIGFERVSKHEDVGAILVVLGAAALAQVVVDALGRALLGWSSALDARGRFMWIALTASGMLMAIGYRGVNGSGAVGGWTPLLAGPLLATWYASERLAGATRAYVQTNEALAMAPELAGMVPAGHAERVRVLVRMLGGPMGISQSELPDLETAALLHHFGQVALDEPVDPSGPASPEVSAVTASMLREVALFEAAGDIVAGDIDDSDAKIAAQVLRCACEYDLLTSRDHMPSDLAIEVLRTAPEYVYESRLVENLERVIRKRAKAG